MHFAASLMTGRLCMSNKAAECKLRAVAVGRRNGPFAASDGGGRLPAAIYTLIATANLKDIDPQISTPSRTMRRQGRRREQATAAGEFPMRLSRLLAARACFRVSGQSVLNADQHNDR
jgi:hypothetical protein